MQSKLFFGQVSHRRFRPHEHEFRYKMFMMYLDLDELPALFKSLRFCSEERFNWVSFYRQDHMGDHRSLKQSIYERVEQQAGISLDGPVRLLTHLRYLGYGFNPVSFYYCFDKKGESVIAIVAEVNNTPWGEQHCYVLPVGEQLGGKTFRFNQPKTFHVSPFNPMEQNYRWVLSHQSHQLGVHIENWQDEEKVFEASMSLMAQTFDQQGLNRALVQFPFITAKISFSIYFQALKLLIKRTPLYPHPKST